MNATKSSRSRSWIIVLGSFALAFAAGSTLATAAPSSVPSDVGAPAVRMPAQELDALRREVARARAADGRPFAELARLVALAPELNERARARRAPLALYVAKLGPNALMPALEMIALAPPRSVPGASGRAIRRELIEAVGLLRDPRALRVLSPILDDVAEDFETTRTATEAMARIGTEAAAQKILSVLATAPADRARAVIGGMGECRQLPVIEALAERLRTATDETTARIAARSLGRAGNAWVWPTLRDRREETRIRETAARALVDAFVRHEGEARSAASNALMVVDAPETPALIADARRATSSPETARALDELAARFARNPARTR